MKVNTKFLTALSGAVLLLAVAGCSSDDSGKKLNDWAKGVCDQAAAPAKQIDDANTAISKVNSGGAPADVQKADSAAFQQLSSAYASLAGIFQKAGAAPNGDEGTTFQQNAVTTLNHLSAQYESLKKQVDALNTSDQNKFADGLKSVSDSLTKTTADVQSSITTLSQGDAGKALAAQPGCQRVSSTASPTAAPTAS
ncbi:small secreted protein [Streptomyces sp. NPDC020917]|uniref:small secreted protein n=1 Tax=Streptomyces sp. NPDC020917 TaxID=3365102 RepID=UPI0037A8AC58